MVDVGAFSQEEPPHPSDGAEARLDGRIEGLQEALDQLSVKAKALNGLRWIIFGIFWMLVGTAVAGLLIRAWAPGLLASMALLPPARLDTVLLLDQAFLVLVFWIYNELKRPGDLISMEISRKWETLRFSMLVGGRGYDDINAMTRRINFALGAFSRASDLSLTGYRNTGLFYAVMGILVVIAEAVISRNL